MEFIQFISVDLAELLDTKYGDVCYAGIDLDPELKYPKGMAPTDLFGFALVLLDWFACRVLPLLALFGEENEGVFRNKEKAVAVFSLVYFLPLFVFCCHCRRGPYKLCDACRLHAGTHRSICADSSHRGGQTGWCGGGVVVMMMVVVVVVRGR